MIIEERNTNTIVVNKVRSGQMCSLGCVGNSNVVNIKLQNTCSMSGEIGSKEVQQFNREMRIVLLSRSIIFS